MTGLVGKGTKKIPKKAWAENARDIPAGMKLRGKTGEAISLAKESGNKNTMVRLCLKENCEEIHRK